MKCEKIKKIYKWLVFYKKNNNKRIYILFYTYLLHMTQTKPSKWNENINNADQKNGHSTENTKKSNINTQDNLDPGQKEVLDDAFKNIEKQFGKWAVIRMWDNANFGLVDTFHSWSYVLDLIIWWGYPYWRVIELYGPESSWKTSIALHAIAAIQERNEIAAFIDAEHALDPYYAKKLWVDTDNLLLSQPNDGEQALQIAEELAKTWAVKLIVIDSVAALVPRAEVEGDMWDSHMWLQARMMSQWLRKLASVLAKTWTTCIFINQIRMKIGIMFGNPETTTWWNALKFFSTQRIEVRKWEAITENKEQIWYNAKITTRKNKIFAPFKKTEIPIIWMEWIARNLDIIESALMLQLITRAWAFYTVWNQKVQWKEKLIALLESDNNLKSKLEEGIKKKIKAMRQGEQVLNDEILEWLHQ